MDDVPQNAMLFFEQHPESYPLYEAFYEKLMSRFPEARAKVQKSQISFYNRHLFRLCFLPAGKEEGRLAGTLFRSHAGASGTVGFWPRGSENRTLSGPLDNTFRDQRDRRPE